MPLNLFYTMVQKSQKWPKTQIKGGSCLKFRDFTSLSIEPTLENWQQLLVGSTAINCDGQDHLKYCNFTNFGVVLFLVISVVNGFTKIKKTPKMKKKILGIVAASVDTEICIPNAPWSLATEILTHRKFVKLQ